MKSHPAGPPRPLIQRLIFTFCQTLFFVGVWVAADYCGRKLGIKIPGAVLGMGAVLALLFSGIVKTRHIGLGADFLLAEMLLFFMPAFVAAMTYFGLFASQGLRLVAAVGLGTVAVMAGTVWVVDSVFQWESKRSAPVDE